MFDQLSKLLSAFDPKQLETLVAEFRNVVQTVNQQSRDIAEIKAQLARIEEWQTTKRQ